jgi:HD superfamily phosphohydrolase
MVDRFIEQSMVLPLEYDEEDLPSPMTCYPEKMIEECVNLFSTRFRMHKLVYTHKVVKAIEYMLTDALKLADPYILIDGTVTPMFPIGKYKMSETIFDMAAFAKMKDSIIDIIEHDPNPKLRAAQDIISRVYSRELYTCIGKTRIVDIKAFKRKSEDSYLEEIIDCDSHLSPDDLIVEKLYIHYGMGSEDPVSHMRFYSKNERNPVGRVVNKCNYETIFPNAFDCGHIRVFSRYKQKDRYVYAAFAKWCRELNAPLPFPSFSQES